MGRERDSLVERERAMKERLAKVTEDIPEYGSSSNIAYKHLPFLHPLSTDLRRPGIRCEGERCRGAKTGHSGKTRDVAAKSALRRRA